MPITVRNLLDGKGHNVVTVEPDMTILEVASILDDKKIGAVVIIGIEERIAGIFTERDLVRAIASEGAAVLQTPVRNRMSTTIRSCHEENTADELMGIMTAGRFRHVPVEIGGRLAGIISIGDVVKARMQEVEHEAEQMKAYIAG